MIRHLLANYDWRSTAYLINWQAIIDSDAEKEGGKSARVGNAESREFRFL
jgi:hypothetical protein